MVKKPTCLDLEAFHSLDKDKRQAYLGVVDKLRELGVGEDLSLPQVQHPRKHCFDANSVNLTACGSR